MPLAGQRCAHERQVRVALGTSAVKAVLLDAEGGLATEASAPPDAADSRHCTRDMEGNGIHRQAHTVATCESCDHKHVACRFRRHLRSLALVVVIVSIRLRPCLAPGKEKGAGVATRPLKLSLTANGQNFILTPMR